MNRLQQNRHKIMSFLTIFLLFCSKCVFPVVGLNNVGSVCGSPDCVCVYNDKTGLVSVSCSCQQSSSLRIGVESTPGSLSPPDNGESLSVENCTNLELYSRLLNQMPDLKNISIKNCNNVILHPKLFEARGASRKAGELENIQLTNIRNLEVRRYTFKDVRVDGMFYLGEVQMTNVVSLAFNLDFVGEFSVFASKFERISMFGVKIGHCKHFNILGMTHFSSLAAHAIKLACDKLSLAYNWFGHLHDSSFDVQYGLSDIQGNTFYSLSGKPFLSLRQSTSENESSEGGKSIPMTGFVFRENKFVSEPVLPFGSLAMPHYRQSSGAGDYFDMDDNQFPCNCLKIGWLLAYSKHGYNSHSLAQIGIDKVGVDSSGTDAFLHQLVSRAGPCLECDNGQCDSADMLLTSFSDTALMVEEGTGVKCAQSGMVIRNYDDTPGKEPADMKRDQSKIVETVKNSQSDKMRVIDGKDSHIHYQQNSEFNERIINGARTLRFNLFICILSCCIIINTL